ncbi:MAG: hypothetical protein LUG24_06595 [Clostridiales bacterium]|nr:hypothetical protein [Clostridiales bacterium]
MLIYDFWHMVKRLVPLYIFLFILQALFREVGEAFNLIMMFGLFITAVVNLNKFWNDYMGKNAVMVNMLPIGGVKKVFSKLLWGFVFSLLFLVAVMLLAFGLRVIFIIPLRLVGILMFYLNCYTAMSVGKNGGRWYYIFFLMILFNVFTGLICFGIYFFTGELASSAVTAVICFILFFISAYCLEN